MSASTPAKRTSPSLSELTNKKDADKEKVDNASSVDNTSPEDESSNKGQGKVEENKDNPSEEFEKAVGPEDGGKTTTIRPEDVEPPVDNSPTEGLKTSVNDNDKADKPVLSESVVGTVPNKTPAQLAAETPKQTEARYGIKQEVSKEDADNPHVQAYRDTHVNQVPSGTHLHPDVAADLLNRGISEQHTDNAQVKRTTTEYYDFAGDAEHNDKF